MLIKFKVKIELPIIRLSSFFKRLKQVLDAVRGERRLAKYQHDLEHWPANFGVVLDNGNEVVGNDGDMNLYAPCILRFSPESFDLEMLLDPFEQLHFPPILVEQGNFLRTEIEVVCVVNETPLKFWGIVGNPSDESWVLLLVLLLGEADTLVFRLGASELCPFEYGHAEVDGSGIDGIESAMQFELLRDASGLGNGHHVKSKLLKDAMVSEGVGLRQHLPVDAKSTLSVYIIHVTAPVYYVVVEFDKCLLSNYNYSTYLILALCCITIIFVLSILYDKTRLLFTDRIYSLVVNAIGYFSYGNK